MKYFVLLGLLLAFTGCQQKNRWSEKDDDYAGYYQSSPPLSDAEYYPSNLNR